MKSASDSKKFFPKHEAPDADVNLKYKKKCKTVKRLIKDLMFENVALCDQIAYLQEKTLALMDERNYLFKKLYNHQQGAHPRTEEYHQLSKQHSSTTVDGASRKTVAKKTKLEPAEAARLQKVIKRTVPPKKKKVIKAIQLDMYGKPLASSQPIGDFNPSFNEH